MRILLLGEYSGLNNELKRALMEVGHEVTLAAASDYFKRYPSDISLGHGSNIYSYKLRQLFLPAIKARQFVGFDVVHIINFYIFPRFPLLNVLLMRFLKENNGVVTLAGAGDDPFFVKYCSTTMRYNPILPHETYDRGGKPYYMRSQHHLAAMHRYMTHVDAVIPIMYEYYSTFCAAGYGSKTSQPVPIPINCSRIPFVSSSENKKKILFFHGLNRRGFKGTFLIEEAFSYISEKYSAEAECLIDGNMPFKKYMSVMAKVDVCVDQVFSYSLAMNSLYSMAQGKVVCSGAETESSVLYGGVLPPVYNLTPEPREIVDVMRQVINDRPLLIQKSEESRLFVESYHAPVLVAKKYTAIWDELVKNKRLP